MFTPTENGFDFAINLQDSALKDILNRTDLLTFAVRQVRQYYEFNETTQTQDLIRDKIDLPLKKCSQTVFNISDPATYERLDIAEHYCSTMRNYTVRGNYIAPNFDYIEF